ncbi:hypothetical protein BD310DRAFT_825649 [Dichomitus squalens]|uniref:Uncharacterized protein n=1 Tax=Dichomitus squalens TaxID=114155 RepID=A0A4Q9PMR8_9APHY|nr:hypothetical protein BD310DRAFT_825649 [Dichomitus squalens]
MHPAYKLAYFRKADWPEEWIQEARRMVTHEWTMRYKPTPAANARASVGSSAGESATRSRPRGLRMSTGGKAVSVGLFSMTPLFWKFTLRTCLVSLAQAAVVLLEVWV